MCISEYEFNCSKDKTKETIHQLHGRWSGSFQSWIMAAEVATSLILIESRNNSSTVAL